MNGTMNGTIDLTLSEHDRELLMLTEQEAAEMWAGMSDEELEAEAKEWEEREKEEERQAACRGELESWLASLSYEQYLALFWPDDMEKPSGKAPADSCSDCGDYYQISLFDMPIGGDYA